MKKHKTFTRDLNSQVFGRRFELDFIEIQFLSTSRYHDVTQSHTVLSLLSRCKKQERRKSAV